MMCATLRQAIPSDAADVTRVYLSSRRQFLPYAPLAHSDDEIRCWVERVLIASGNVTVAEDSDRIVGMMATSTVAEVSWIDQLYLIAAVTGRGIGKEFLNHAKERLSLPIRLYTFQANSGARRFYEKHGFQSILFTDGAGNEEKCPDVLYQLYFPR